MSAPAHDPHCPGCRAHIRLDFTSQFKVGDIIAGFSTRKRMRITAIGKRRFLYEDMTNSHRNSEYVAAMAGPFGWELIERAKDSGAAE